MVFKEMIFLFNQCFDLVVKPSRVLVIRDYIFIWNEIITNIKHGLVEEICFFIQNKHFWSKKLIFIKF